MGLIQMSKCLLAMGVAVAAMTAARAEFSLGGSEGVIAETDGAVVFDSGRAADSTKFRYAGAHWNETFDGDFTVETDSVGTVPAELGTVPAELVVWIP